MPLDLQRARPLLHDGNLVKLFVEELGWEPCRQKLTLRAGDTNHAFTAIAEKRGFTAWLCASTDNRLPDHTTRLKLDRALTQTSFEHLIVFATDDYTQQSWMWVRREPGRPLSARTHEFNRGQPGDSLLQKLNILYVSLEEEEKDELSTVTMAERGRAAFYAEKVTKQFYDRFTDEHAAFLKFIKGIKGRADLEWYTSIMLNRLMFVYFIQKKHFLDGDLDYLRNRLKMTQRVQGKDKFQSFYRYFLLRLFHDGLGKASGDRKPEFDKLLGKVPYLNGGFFEVHELEERNTDIDIPDKAFEALFNFFDQYSWQLDERPLRADNEINPDVVGYIFEKYVNQKQMGAYYTKEDITEYISKNTIIPFLFDAAEKKCAVAFRPDSFLWRLLRDDPDRYIYAAVKHGVIDAKANIIPLPSEIDAGIKDVANRHGWNKPADPVHALPTETWREHIARRQRCLEVRRKLREGQVYDINDLITLNIDIRQFAQDVIASSEGSELVRAFYQAIETVTVLDPTCGSGAFLFAALNVLQPLYEACLERMATFVAEAERNKSSLHPERFTDFRNTLDRIKLHPNHNYFVLKSIIVNNLYGVDIMEEAVEICKLRLFLKLVAQVETANDIEPLPDIDFNIRVGNTLVGFASVDQVRKSMEGTLSFAGKQVDKINKDALVVESIFKLFRDQQTKHRGSRTAAHKQELRRRLLQLDLELDCYLAGEYGVDPEKLEPFEKWRRSHQPFHWFIEFYGIMREGGFDVVIGNPPYVEYRKLVSLYTLQEGAYSTESCGNLLAFVTERSLALTAPSARIGFILLVSTFSTERMEPLQKALRIDCATLWISNFAWRPSKLFSGANTINSILLAERAGTTRNKALLSTKYNKWSNEERAHLFSVLSYGDATNHVCTGCFPKVAGPIDTSVVRRIAQCKDSLADWFDGTGDANHLYYFRGMLYWIKVLDRLPVHKEDGEAVISGQCKEVVVRSAIPAHAVISIMSSSLFFWYYQTFSDCQQINRREFQGFRVGMGAVVIRRLAELGKQLMDDYRLHSRVVVRQNKARGVEVRKEYFTINLSKPIIDEIDHILGGAYGMTDEEIDFITNYDIKYRIGADDDADD